MAIDDGLGEIRTVYVAAAMQGTQDGGRREIAVGVAIVKAAGMIPISPIDLAKARGYPPPDDCTPHQWERILLELLGDVAKADAILLMGSWLYSPGARLEAFWALTIGTPILAAPMGAPFRMETWRVLAGIANVTAKPRPFGCGQTNLEVYGERLTRVALPPDGSACRLGAGCPFCALTAPYQIEAEPMLPSPTDQIRAEVSVPMIRRRTRPGPRGGAVYDTPLGEVHVEPLAADVCPRCGAAGVEPIMSDDPEAPTGCPKCLEVKP